MNIISIIFFIIIFYLIIKLIFPTTIKKEKNSTIRWNLSIKDINFPKEYNEYILENNDSEINQIRKIPKINNFEIKKLFTKQELLLYNQLKNFTQEKKVLLFSKVRIADLVEIKNYSNNSEFYSLFRKVSQKHIDYIITDYNGQILCLIELDGKSHNNYNTRKNDMFKDKLFKDIGIPLIRYKNYEYHDLKKLQIS